MIDREVVATTVTVAGASSTISSTGVLFGTIGSTGLLICGTVSVSSNVCKMTIPDQVEHAPVDLLTSTE